MGNCLGVESQYVRHKKIEYEASIFTQCQAVSDTKYMNPNASKMVWFSDAEVEEVASPSLRVKLVISKQKLKEMIASGKVAIEGMVSEMVQNQENEVKDFDCYEDCNNIRDRAWKPALKSIPESECYM